MPTPTPTNTLFEGNSAVDGNPLTNTPTPNTTTPVPSMPTRTVNIPTSNSYFYNSSLNSKTRLNLLNDTYRKRYIEYIKILLVVVVTLISIWICRILENMNYIDSTTSDLSMIKIIVFYGFIILAYYKNIQYHNLIVYDELQFKSPELLDLSNGIISPTPTGIVSASESSKCRNPENSDLFSDFTLYIQNLYSGSASTSAKPSITPTPSTSPTPSITPTPSTSAKPSITPTPSTSATPSITPTPSTSK
jgi:hypothetical protein